MLKNTIFPFLYWTHKALYKTKKSLAISNILIVSDLYVIQLGLEPSTYSLEGCCSIQLSYWTLLKSGANIVLILYFRKYFCVFI